MQANADDVDDLLTFEVVVKTSPGATWTAAEAACFFVNRIALGVPDPYVTRLSKDGSVVRVAFGVTQTRLEESLVRAPLMEKLDLFSVMSDLMKSDDARQSTDFQHTKVGWHAGVREVRRQQARAGHLYLRTKYGADPDAVVGTANDILYEQASDWRLVKGFTNKDAGYLFCAAEWREDTDEEPEQGVLEAMLTVLQQAFAPVKLGMACFATDDGDWVEAAIARPRKEKKRGSRGGRRAREERQRGGAARQQDAQPKRPAPRKENPPGKGPASENRHEENGQAPGAAPYSPRSFNDAIVAARREGFSQGMAREKVIQDQFDVERQKYEDLFYRERAEKEALAKQLEVLSARLDALMAQMEALTPSKRPQVQSGVTDHATSAATAALTQPAAAIPVVKAVGKAKGNKPTKPKKTQQEVERERREKQMLIASKAAHAKARAEELREEQAAQQKRRDDAQSKEALAAKARQDKEEYERQCAADLGLVDDAAEAPVAQTSKGSSVSKGKKQQDRRRQEQAAEVLRANRRAVQARHPRTHVNLDDSDMRDDEVPLRNAHTHLESEEQAPVETQFNHDDEGDVPMPGLDSASSATSGDEVDSDPQPLKVAKQLSKPAAEPPSLGKRTEEDRLSDEAREKDVRATKTTRARGEAPEPLPLAQMDQPIDDQNDFGIDNGTTGAVDATPDAMVASGASQ